MCKKIFNRTEKRGSKIIKYSMKLCIGSIEILTLKHKLFFRLHQRDKGRWYTFWYNGNLRWKLLGTKVVLDRLIMSWYKGSPRKMEDVMVKR